MNEYLVIIPTYNESNTIKIILEKIINLNMLVDILVVDDNSPDKTFEVIENHKLYNENLFLIKRDKKRGLGSAYIEGFKWAIDNNYKFVIQIDADMSHNPNDINRLIKYSKANDLVIGSRYIKGISIINWPLSRLILSYIANLYSRLLTGMNIKDTTGGFKCFSVNVLKSINLDLVKSEGYSFQIELNYLTWLKKYKIKEIPIIFTDRTIGESKMSKKIIFEAIYMVPFLRIKKIFKLFK
tara:strand:- start:2479 stop:3198 length:720 start_codon:yes stop_codon:yes gene_type:complete